MLDVEEVAIRNYHSKKGKFLVLLNDKNGFHIACKSNPLAKIPLFGRLVKWYYEKKLPAVVQYLLSDMSGFQAVQITELRNKVKATIDRFFASAAHNQSPLHRRCFAAYERTFPQERPIYAPVVMPKPNVEPPLARIPEKKPVTAASPKPPVIVKQPELNPDPVVVLVQPEPQNDHAGQPILEKLEIEPEEHESHDDWVKKFENRHCIVEEGARIYFQNGLKIEPEFAMELKKLLLRLPNLHFYFTKPLGVRPDPNLETFKEAVKSGPDDALWVQVIVFKGLCNLYAQSPIEIFNQSFLSFNLGGISKGLGLSYDPNNRASFLNKFISDTSCPELIEKVAVSTKAIKKMI